MSKKKNTLKDLDEFLKQQAATLVSPVQLGEKVNAAPEEKAAEHVAPEAKVVETTQISARTILSDLQALAKSDKNFRKEFYDIIIQSIEAQPDSSAEDKMLINTALYLKSGDRWKEVIRDYWRNKG